MTFTRSVLAPLLVLLLIGGCSDGPADPKPKQLSVQIRKGTVPFEEETVAPGAVLQLSAVLLDASGKQATGEAVQWSSDSPAVADVDGSGRVTAGQTVGTARIVASSGTRADTALVNVAQPVSSAVACPSDAPGLSLAVGEVRSFSGADAVSLCVAGGLTGAEYTLVPFNGSQVAASQLALQVLAHSVGLVTGPPNPSRSPLAAPEEVDDAPRRDERFHRHLLERSHARNEWRLRSSRALQLSPGGAPSFAAVGDLLRLNVEARSSDGCGNTDYRTGRVVALTDKAVIVADTANPRDGFTEQDYRSIGAVFDTLVWRVGTESFGAPSDVDKNSKVLIFYTRAVNELTGAGQDSYVGGFFYNRDLFPQTGDNACKGSNYAEMFYMMVPDPRGTINGNERSLEFVRRSTLSVLAHEFQHLINDSRRLYENQAPVWEESWLNEGLSHVAEELMFYATSGVGPRQNLGPEQLTGATADAYRLYGADNTERLIRYLREPERRSLMGDGDQLATRGAIWNFLRYAADREPGSDAVLWKRMANSTTQGLETLRGVLGVEPREWMRDWAVSLYTDDAGLGVEERYQQPSWNFRSLIPAMHGSISRYPLRTVNLSNSGVQVTLAGGGAAYLRFAVLAGQKAGVQTTVGSLPPPSLLRVALIRTK